MVGMRVGEGWGGDKVWGWVSVNDVQNIVQDHFQ